MCCDAMLDPAGSTFPRRRSRANPFVRYRRCPMRTTWPARTAWRTSDYARSSSSWTPRSRGWTATGSRRRRSRVRPRSASGSACPGAACGSRTRPATSSGSHKARHLFGLLLHLEVVERLGLVDAAGATATWPSPAAATRRWPRPSWRARRRAPLRVFVPPDADPAVVARLARPGRAGHGVPARSRRARRSHLRRAARRRCRRARCPSPVRATRTGWRSRAGRRSATRWSRTSWQPGCALDDVVVQVGGGALASAVAGVRRGRGAWACLPRMPRLHTVQTRGLAA